MTARLFFTIVVAALALFAQTLRAATVPDTDREAYQSALQVVKLYNYPQLMNRRVIDAFQKTKRYEALVTQLGRERAQQVLIGAVTSSMPKYLSEQEDLMATALARTVPIKELGSLALAGRDSPYAGQFRARSEIAAQSIRSEQRDLERRITLDISRSLNSSLRAESIVQAPNNRLEPQRHE